MKNITLFFLTALFSFYMVMPKSSENMPHVIWQPTPSTTWQIQLMDKMDVSVSGDVYDIDLFDTPAETIKQLHQQGRKVICYFSAGTYESWRPDAHLYPKKIKGNPLPEWPGEQWLDIRRIDLLGPILRSRFNLAKEKGCDAVDPDNVDGYQNDTGFSLAYLDQLRFNQWLSNEAHERELSIGLKNDLEQIPDLLPYFDFTINESCFEYDECHSLLPFIKNNKAVFGIEYNTDPATFCPIAKKMKLSTIKKRKTLDAWRVVCPFHRNFESAT